MLIIITIGILLGAHAYIHIVELQEENEAQGNTVKKKDVREKR